jgi:two-component system, LytTR family, response regulator
MFEYLLKRFIIMSKEKTTLAIPIQPVKQESILRTLPALKKINWNKLAIFCLDEIRFVPFAEIMYCKAESNYTNIITRSGKSYLCCKTLKDIAAKLPDNIFMRIHQSYVVSMPDITALKKHTAEIELNNTVLLPVAKMKKHEVYGLFNV